MMARPARVLIAGNIGIDLFPSFPAAALDSAALLAPGSITRIGPVAVAIGGCVANSGTVLHRLGIPTSFVFAVGADHFGALVERLLRDNTGADARFVAHRLKESDTSYTIVVSAPDRDRTLLGHSGANDLFGADFVSDADIAGHDLLHFGYPPGMRRIYRDEGAELRLLLQRARDRGVTTALDSSNVDAAGRREVDWNLLFGRALPLVDLFLPSLDDLVAVLERTTGDAAPIRDFEALEPVARGRLLRRLAEHHLGQGAAVVALKLGRHGLYLRTAAAPDRLRRAAGRLPIDPAAWTGRELYRPCFRAAVSGTTGAGDSTVSGFLAAVCRGADPEAAVTAALATGACSTEAVDATSAVPPWPRIEQRLVAGWPRHPATVVLE